MARQHLSPRGSGSLIVVGVLLVLSLGAAVVLFYFLDSYAQVQNKYVSLGGAAAGCLVIFVLLRDTYFKVTSTEREWARLEYEEKIRRLDDEKRVVVRSKLKDFRVPTGFKEEISREFYFGFSYPEDWEFIRFPQETLYGSALDPESAERLGFARNVNVFISDISGTSLDAEDLSLLYETGSATAMAMLPSAELVYSEEFSFQGLPANRLVVNWVTNLGQELTAYQIRVADEDRKSLYTITFTTTQEDFESSRRLFDDIVATFRP